MLKGRRADADRPVIVIGAGGHAKVLIHCLVSQGRKIIGLLDSDLEKWGALLLGVKVTGDEDELESHPVDKVELVNGIGSTGDVQRRKGVFERLKGRGFSFARVVDSSAIIADDVKIGEGGQVLAGVIIQPGAAIGANAVINTGGIVEHDCRIGDHAHISPGATLCGNVNVQPEAHVGAGSVILQGIELGRGCVVGAGSVVTRPVGNGVKAFGVPAKPQGRV